MSMPPKVAQLGLIPRLLKKLHKLPIYQEVEKVSGNVIPDSSSAVYLGSIAIPVYREVLETVSDKSP